MSCQPKKYSHIREHKSIQESILLLVGSTETMPVQLLLLLLVTLPLPSFASITTSKGKGLLNRDAQEGSHLFRLDPGYNVAVVPPSDGPLQIRYDIDDYNQDDAHDDDQGQLEPEEHPGDRRGCANNQPRRHHQVPVDGLQGMKAGNDQLFWGEK